MILLRLWRCKHTTVRQVFHRCALGRDWCAAGRGAPDDDDGDTTAAGPPRPIIIDPTRNGAAARAPPGTCGAYIILFFNFHRNRMASAVAVPAGGRARTQKTFPRCVRARNNSPISLPAAPPLIYYYYYLFIFSSKRNTRSRFNTRGTRTPPPPLR